ncbi:MAG: prepilin-type N-terminal cleavage/methylation domain-containing protein [Candidatus Levybacteria bacterium]|nr:prepilin-type N-terminal cleavage/methylation domain-containing protein [Candidatus Levybacteria bacterium]
MRQFQISSIRQAQDKNFKFQISKGFTLIELLVVISIIGILTSIVAVNLQVVRQRTRDAQRKSDLKQIQSALELIRADHGCYPNSLCSGANSFPACGNALKDTSQTIIYMQKIPCDPLDASNYSYGSPLGLTYTLTACLENTADPEKDTSVTCPSGRIGYKVINP